MTNLDIKENPSGTDMGGRYRIYEWYDGQWNGSGTLGPFDHKEGAIRGIDDQFKRHPDYHICVVDRMGNIVYQVGNTDHHLLLVRIPAPKFKVGEIVRSKNGEHQGSVGKVESVRFGSAIILPDGAVLGGGWWVRYIGKNGEDYSDSEFMLEEWL